MATINESINENNDKVFDVILDKGEDQVALATANTYVDKNIIFKIQPANPEETGAFAIRYNTNLSALEIVNEVNLNPDTEYLTNLINENINIDSIEDGTINSLT